MSDVRIVKVDGKGNPTPPTPSPKKTRHAPAHRQKQPKHGVLKHGKTARKAPRFEGVKDPAKAPPMTKRKSTLRILTEKGVSKRRKTIKNQVDKMPIHAVRATLRKSGLHVSDKTPPELARAILAGGQEAGIVSSS